MTLHNKLFTEACVFFHFRGFRDSRDFRGKMARFPLLKMRCGWGRNRTADTRIFSPLLCQLSYPAELPRYYRDASRGGCSLKQKTLNPQRRVAAAIYRRSQSAATETSRLDRASPYHCRVSIPACCFFAAGGSACPKSFRAQSPFNW